MQQQQTPWAVALQENDPKLAELIDSGRDLITTDGALSAKVKTLMSMICDALLAHGDGVAAIADRARGLGATEDEIAETVRVAYWMGGVPALVMGVNAYKKS